MKKMLSASRGWMHENIPTKGLEGKKIRSKILKQREYNRKAELISIMRKESEGLEEGPKTKIHLYFSERHSKKYPTWKRLDMMPYMDSGLKTSFQSMAIEINRCQQKRDILEGWQNEKPH